MPRDPQRKAFLSERGSQLDEARDTSSMTYSGNTVELRHSAVLRQLIHAIKTALLVDQLLEIAYDRIRASAVAFSRPHFDVPSSGEVNSGPRTLSSGEGRRIWRTKFHKIAVRGMLQSASNKGMFDMMIQVGVWSFLGQSLSKA